MSRGNTHWKAKLLSAKVTRGLRQWFNEQPVSSHDPDYVIEKWDWIKPGEYNTSDWTTVKDSGAAVAVVADALNGELALTSTATTDDDGASIQSVQENFKLTSGKQMWFEAKVKASSVLAQDAFIGFSVAFATNPEAILSGTDRVGFLLEDGAATLKAISTSDGSNIESTSVATLVDATYITLGIHWDGAKAHFYVNRSLKASHSTYLPNAAMAIALFSLSGSDVGTRSLTCDYIHCIVER